jgi:transcription elongation GreA/GreB family factor
MRKRLLPLVILGMFALTFAYPAAAPAALPEPHPEIHAAINSLRHAKEHLEHAAHDYGGHRAEAIGAIDRAIEQLEVCLKYDR